MLYSESAAELATMMTTVHNTTDFSSLHQAARNGDAHALRRLIEIVDPAAAAKIDSVLRSQKEWTVQKSNRTVSIKAAKQVCHAYFRVGWQAIKCTTEDDNTSVKFAAARIEIHVTRNNYNSQQPDRVPRPLCHLFARHRVQYVGRQPNTTVAMILS